MFTGSELRQKVPFFKERYFLIKYIFHSASHSLFDISSSWDYEASSDQVRTMISHYRVTVTRNEEGCNKESFKYFNQNRKIAIAGL